MIDHFHFSPDPEHAARSDRAMHAGLADSLRQICKASDGKVEFDRVSVERLIADIESGRRLSPNAFAIYYELVPALLENRLDEARTLFAELARQRPIETPSRMLALGEPAMADRQERYMCFMKTTAPTITFSCRRLQPIWRPSCVSSPASRNCCRKPRRSSSPN